MKILKIFGSQPVVLIAYWVFCYELSSLCQYGRYDHAVNILILSLVILVVMFVVSSIQSFKNKEFQLFHQKKWILGCVSFFVILTSFYGVKIYKSATPYGGKLAWVIERIKNERTVEFVSNNVFEFGVSGIFDDINAKLDLPEELYLSDQFNLTFNSLGLITSFDTFIYGKNDRAEDVSFLIYYDEFMDGKLKVRLNGYVHADYVEDKLLAPLLETVESIDFKPLVESWDEDEFGMYYEGKRSWPYSTEGITVLLKPGEEQPLLTGVNEWVGYTVSVFVSGKEDVITPVRYNLLRYFESVKADDTVSEKPIKKTENQVFISDEVGYELVVVDKALGSTLYSLNKTIDGGKSWSVLNENPFSGAVGDILGITFLTDQLGFLSASRSGGSYGELYRTDDGGLSYERIDIKSYEVILDNGATIYPFDCPLIPYEENGALYVLVGQGNDGDYLGHSQALYESLDEGKTWGFVKIVE